VPEVASIVAGVVWRKHGEYIVNVRQIL